jgi:hypothetical protein
MSPSERAVDELGRLLDAGADLTRAAARAAQVFEDAFGDRLQVFLRSLDRYPPADWKARVDALFHRLKNGKTARVKKAAVRVLAQIGGADRWAQPLPHLHVPDLWPRLWEFAHSPQRELANEIYGGIVWGLRACPNRRVAEKFVFNNGLTHAAVEWAGMGEDTCRLMDRIFKAGLESRTTPSTFTIVYELQNGRPAAALELLCKLKPDSQRRQVQHLGVYGLRLQPVAAVIAWLGGILDLSDPELRAGAAEAACERAEEGQDIGPILPNLGRVLDSTTWAGEGGQALWWSAAALAVTAKRLPPRKEAAMAELTARLPGKAVAREGAGYGLAMAAALAGDWGLARQLLEHADAKVCAGAILGLANASRHMPGGLRECRRVVKPLLPHIHRLTAASRPAVAKAAANMLRWW